MYAADAFTDFLHDIPPERCLHDRVREIAGFHTRAAGSCPICTTLNSRFGVEQGEPFVMLGGPKVNIFFPLFWKVSIHAAGVEARRIPDYIETVMRLTVVVAPEIDLLLPFRY
jgi:hypothetical protein